MAVKATILKFLVASFQYHCYDTDLNPHKFFVKTTCRPRSSGRKAKRLPVCLGYWLRLGNILDFNAPSGIEKKAFRPLLPSTLDST